MKIFPMLMLVIMVSCVSEKKAKDDASENAAVIERKIVDFHEALKQVYNGVPLKTDSLMDTFFDKNVYYVTYWGTTEPIDSTKSRLRRAVSNIKDYNNRLESIYVSVYGDGAYAFFVLRQTYNINGIPMDEYLPTTFVFERKDNRWLVVHSHRSADEMTFSRFLDAARRHKMTANQEKK